ncbi:hypothetical protein ECC02_003802 [Trypanosoma cruzi]|uniref:Uncharacterized protein n=1 Tax=Trypanosoma cruzi TaxID=5693 RepID=A0A7J6Y928_TRYCR|nr:hypothetical protein ECC02_013122 [Trypanosoma cruzi]KAF5223261.1 hypothetical protein ECC02_003801 [Trypanosoma cruzi]KAF5223262.1 hypothetical protein ECC02_003802 [Trypanosoma cruzi]
MRNRGEIIIMIRRQKPHAVFSFFLPAPLYYPELWPKQKRQRKPHDAPPASYASTPSITRLQGRLLYLPFTLPGPLVGVIEAATLWIPKSPPRPARTRRALSFERIPPCASRCSHRGAAPPFFISRASGGGFSPVSRATVRLSYFHPVSRWRGSSQLPHNTPLLPAGVAAHAFNAFVAAAAAAAAAATPGQGLLFTIGRDSVVAAYSFPYDNPKPRRPSRRTARTTRKKTTRRTNVYFILFRPHTAAKGKQQTNKYAAGDKKKKKNRRSFITFAVPSFCWPPTAYACPPTIRRRQGPYKEPTKAPQTDGVATPLV